MRAEPDRAKMVLLKKKMVRRKINCLKQKIVATVVTFLCVCECMCVRGMVLIEQERLNFFSDIKQNVEFTILASMLRKSRGQSQG